MKNNPTARKAYIAFLMLAIVVGTVLLAISIQSIEFKPARGAPPAISLFDSEGEPETIAPLAEGGSSPADLPVMTSDPDLFIAILFGAVGFALVVTRDGRRSLLRAIVQGISFGLVMYYLGPYVEELINSLFGGIGQRDAGGEQGILPPMPSIYRSLASLPIAIAITLLAWRLYQRLKQVNSADKSSFIENVQATLDQLDSGAELRQTILDCYRAMLTHAQREKLINPSRSATSIELEQKLVQYGLPERETGRLTRLFEEVRYGSHQATERERREARDCLVGFIDACERKFGRKTEPTA